MNLPIPLSLLFCFVHSLVAIAGAGEISMELPDGDEIAVSHYAAEGDTRLVWLPSEFGISPRQEPTARALAARGIDTWIPDLHSAYFIPPGRYSLNEVDPAAVSAIIQHATEDGHSVFLLAGGRTNALALRALRHYQLHHEDTARVRGIISIGPRLFLRTPQGGEAERFLPIASASNVPVFILQPRDAGGFWRVSKVAEKLASGGAPTYTQVLQDVSDGFNLRDEFSPQEERVTRALPDTLLTAMQLLEFHDGLPGTAAPLAGEDLAPEANSGSALLKPYPANRKTPTLRLADLQGKTHDLADYAGKVVVLNFWATWCPPCVEELPSLQRLQQARKARGLEILTVDVGESREDIAQFLADLETQVDFPVLVDSDGEQLHRWGVHAFPTTLLLDRSHLIRYAGFGAFAWDGPEVLEIIDRLLAGS